jgi:hypothetical protein
VGHRLDEAGLAASGRSLQDNGQTLTVGGFENGFLVADCLVLGARRVCGRDRAILLSERGLVGHCYPSASRRVAVNGT